jgi:hypothetical protein
MPTSTQTSKPRVERRVSVRLPMQVSGRDARGVLFTEETSSENLCRNGAAFLTHFEVAVGSDLAIRIPRAQLGSRREEADFSTRGRVVHVAAAAGSAGHRVVGVQFTGPRFQRMFRSESAA